jgi:hypothetical protein
MAGQGDYTSAELEAELLDLRRTLAELGAAGEEDLAADQFLELLRRRARQQPPQEGGLPVDLASAIRQELDGAA